MLILEILLWTSILAVGYVYFGYPFLISYLARRHPAPAVAVSEENSEWPFVTLIIAAYREERVILERLENALRLDYPTNRFEILIGCDGNEDATGELVELFGDKHVRCLQFPHRRGKASVLNDCVQAARGDVLVFSDANTMFDADALQRLVRPFDDPEIGGVCGKLVLTDPITGQNVDGVYWKFENFLKVREAQFGGLLGMNGAIYALRRELYQPIPANTIADDFVIGMRLYQQGWRLHFAQSAIAREQTPERIQDEFQRRVRLGAGGFQSLRWLYPLLHPRCGRIAVTFWSHKVLRWMCPFFMLTAFATNAALAGHALYAYLFAAQIGFYALAAIGSWAGQRRGLRLLRVPAMFVSMNAALLLGARRWLTGELSGAWQRTDRSAEPVSSPTETVPSRDESDSERANDNAELASL